MNGGKAVGMDGVVVEMLKNGGFCITVVVAGDIQKMYGVYCCIKGLEGSMYHAKFIKKNLFKKIIE